MDCIIKTTTNGNDSQLGKTLESILGSDETTVNLHYNYFKSEVFKNSFGDWESEYALDVDDKTIPTNRLDDNGEPLLIKDEDSGKHYYIDRHNKKIFYPLQVNNKALNDLFTDKILDDLTNAIAMKYVEPLLNEGFLDFNMEMEFPGLVGFITNYLTEKSNDLLNSEFDTSIPMEEAVSKLANDKINGSSLQKSIEHVDEWAGRVERFFEARKLSLLDNEALVEGDINSESTRSEMAWGQASFERSARSNVSSDIRLGLSLLKDPTRIDPITGDPMFVPFSEVYGTLIGELSDIVPVEGQDQFSLYMDRLNSLKGKKPYIGELVERLTLSEDYVQYKFIQAVNVGLNDFMSTRLIKGDDGYKYDFLNLTSAADKVSSIRGNWLSDFKRELSGGRQTLDKGSDLLKSIKSRISGLSSRASEMTSNDPVVVEGFMEFVYDILEDMGIPLNVYRNFEGKLVSDVFEHYLDGLKPDVQPDNVRRGNLVRLIESLEYLNDNALNVESINGADNIFQSQRVFSELASSEAFFTGNDMDSSIFRQGKSKYLYSNRSHLSAQVSRFKEDPTTMLEIASRGKFYEHSNYIDSIKNSMDISRLPDESDEAYYERQLQSAKEALNDFKVLIFNDFYLDGPDTKSSDSKDITHLDLTLDSINKALSFNKRGGRAIFSSPTPADKGTLAQLQVPNSFLVRSRARKNGNKVVMSEESILHIYKYVLGEFERIKEAYKEIEAADGDNSRLRVNYHLKNIDGEWVAGEGNGTKFQLLPSLNDPAIADYLYVDGKLNTDLVLAHPSTIYDISELAETSPTTYKLLIDIGNHLSDTINMHVDSLRESGDLQLVDADIRESYVNNYREDADYGMVGDYLINGIAAQLEYSKLFTGDYSYYKTMEDYKKRVPATYTDGLYPASSDKVNPYFRMATIENVDIGAWDVSNLEKLVGTSIANFYRQRIDSTDAQAWITPNRWKDIHVMTGKWSPAHDVVFDKITGVDSTPMTFEESMIAAQPIKGVFFSVEDGAPTFLKYSQAVLTKQLTDSAEGLSHIKDMMDNSGVDELVTLSGVKVGSIMPNRIHTDEGDVVPGVKLESVQLSNLDYKIQQDLSPKGVKDTDIGSQVQQMVFAALHPLMDSNFTTPSGENITGSELASRIHSLASTKSNEGMEKFKQSMGLNKDGEGVDRERMFRSIYNSLLERESTPSNLLDAIEAGINPYAIPGFSGLVQQTVASSARSKTVKIKTKGGSFIQMADFGISKQEGDNLGIVWTPWADDKLNLPSIAKDKNGNDLYNEYKNPDGSVKKVPVVRPGGVLIPSSFITRLIPNWRENYTVEELFGTPEKNYTDGVIDSRILQTLIGYRIPTQGLASVDGLHVAGILPDSIADTVIAYTGITTKTGSDYDIDKMYMMMPDYRKRYVNEVKMSEIVWSTVKGKNINETISTINDVIDRIDGDFDLNISDDVLLKVLSDESRVEELKLLQRALLDLITNSDSEVAQSYRNQIDKLIDESKEEVKLEYVEDGLGSQMVESYFTAMTNFDIMDQVMTPIDHDFMKDDILSLRPDGEKESFQDFNPLREIDLRIDLMVGTMGVGASANAGKDHIRGLFSDGRYLIDKIRLDLPFSDKLSRKDLEYYAKETNRTIDEVSENSSIRIMDSLSAVLNAFVDIANDNYITRANWTPDTFGVGLFLLRAGVHPYKVNSYLANPLIREYTQFLGREKSISIDNPRNTLVRFIDKKIGDLLSAHDVSLSNGIDVNVGEIFNELGYRKGLSEFYLKSKYGSDITYQDMMSIRNIYYDTLKESGIPTDYSTSISHRDNKKSVEDRIPSNIFNMDLEPLREMAKLEEGNYNMKDYPLMFSIIDSFDDIQQTARKASLAIRASKPDTYGWGKDLLDLQLSRNTLYSVLTDDSIEGFRSRLLLNGEPTFLATMLNNSLVESTKFFQENVSDFIDIHPTVVSTFNSISSIIYGDVLTSEELGTKLRNNYYTHMMSGFEPFQVSEQGRSDLLGNIPNKILDLKKSSYRNNPFIEALEVRDGDRGVKFVGIPNKKYSVDKVNAIIGGWKTLFGDYPLLASDLARYSYITSGFQNNPNNFFKFIPYEYLAAHNINDYITRFSRELDAMSTVDEAFIENFMRHNLDDNSIAPVIDPNHKSISNVPITVGFRLTSKSKGKTVNRDANRPYITLENINPLTMEVDKMFYEKLGEYMDKYENVHSVYARVSKLGYRDSRGNSVFEYNRFSENTSSELAVNKLRQQESIDLFKVKVNQSSAIDTFLKRPDYTSHYSVNSIIENAVAERVIDNAINEVNSKDLGSQEIKRDDINC